MMLNKKWRSKNTALLLLICMPVIFLPEIVHGLSANTSPPNTHRLQASEQRRALHPRRSFLSKSIKKAASLGTAIVLTNGNIGSSVAAETAPTDEKSAGDNSPRRIIRFTSGVQCSDLSVGNGPVLSKTDTVLLHIKALSMDDSVIFDTRVEGQPILHPLGSSTLDSNLLGDSVQRRSRVTMGLEDAIVSRGQASWEGGFGTVEPMHEGGMRLVVVPGAMAYGNSGISRYDAYTMGFRKPVPRDEIIRYQVEVLRCMDMEIPSPNGTGEMMPVRSCCSDQNYPCKGPKDNSL